MLELIQLAFRNLSRRRVRTSLTILGVGLALSLVIASMGFSEGHMAAFRQTIEKLGADIFVLPKDQSLMTLGAETLPQKYAERIAELENVRAVVPELHFRMSGRLPLPIMVVGIPPESFKELKPYLRVEEGRLLAAGDRNVALLGHASASTLKLGVNEELTIGGTNFTVIGVLEPSGELVDSMLFVPLPSLQEALGLEGRVTNFLVFLKDARRASETAQQIEAELGVSAYTIKAVVEQVGELTRVVDALRFAWYLIVLTVGTLFILCVMIMAVTERTREIGVMRAVGATPGYIFRLILAESILMGLVAGVFGCIFGVAFATIGELIIAYFLGFSYKPVFSAGTMLAAFAITFAVGCLAGLYPAWRASKIEVIEALRYE